MTIKNDRCFILNDTSFVWSMKAIENISDSNIYYCRNITLVMLNRLRFKHIGVVNLLSVCLFVVNAILPSKLHMIYTWWRHQLETFSAFLAFCVKNSPVTGKFPSQRSVTRSFDIFFDLCLNKRLSKRSWSSWIETQLRPLWRHRSEFLG